VRLGKIQNLLASSVVTYIVVTNNYWPALCIGLFQEYRMVQYPWEGRIFLFLEKIQEYDTVWYRTLRKGVFLEKIQEYLMVRYAWEGDLTLKVGLVFFSNRKTLPKLELAN
jgi:hypothetical protein